MIALLVVLTFVVAILLDHLLLRQPIVLAEAPRPNAEPRARIAPSVVAGFELPENLRYHPGHTWAAAEGGDLVKIGADDFAVKFAGDVLKVDIPARGQWIRQGQRIIAMKSGDREIDLVSPIEGTIVDVNEAVLANPELAAKDPYGDGWLLEVHSPDSKTNFRNLLGGTVARKWMDDSAARLRAFAHVPTTAQDGGMAIGSLAAHLTPEEFDKAQKDLFLG